MYVHQCVRASSYRLALWRSTYAQCRRFENLGTKTLGEVGEEEQNALFTVCPEDNGKSYTSPESTFFKVLCNMQNIAPCTSHISAILTITGSTFE